MYCVDKICKFLIVSLFVYYVGGALFRLFFDVSGAATTGSTLIDSIDDITSI